jgi:hypothetical protein
VLDLRHVLQRLAWATFVGGSGGVADSCHAQAMPGWKTRHNPSPEVGRLLRAAGLLSHEAARKLAGR